MKYRKSTPIECPVCIQNPPPGLDDDDMPLLWIMEWDFDELNWEGSIELKCYLCGTRFTTGLVHLHKSDEFYKEGA